MKREAVSKRTRFETFKRDGFTCQYCGQSPPGVLLEIDHIHPVAEGGTSHADNLITACEACNRGKGAVLLSSIPETLAAKGARIKEAEEQLAAYNAILQAKRDRIEEQSWLVVFELTGKDSIRTPKFASIKTFVERLGLEEVMEAVSITRRRFPNRSETRTPFLYFCGICWRKIREQPPCS